MSKDDQFSIELPAPTIERILLAADVSEQTPQEVSDKIGQFLSVAFSRAVRRAHGRPLKKKEVDKLERAYDRLVYLIKNLQDSSDPPPMMQTSESGATDWDHWIADQQTFGFRRGRPNSCDWRFVSQLLAIFEVVFQIEPSFNQEQGPTMRFLDQAYLELAKHVPPEAQERFVTPEFEAAKKQLSKLKETHLPKAIQGLRKLLPEGENK